MLCRLVVILLLNHALVVEMVLNVSKRRTRLENLLSGWKCNVRFAAEETFCLRLQCVVAGCVA